MTTLELYKTSERAYKNPDIAYDNFFVYGAFAENEDELALCFAPTSTRFWDWVINFLSTPFRGYHRGYKISALSVLYSTFKAVKKKDPKRLILAGYSKGGGIAQVLSDLLFKLWRNNPPFEIELVTFGSPKAVSIFKCVHGDSPLRSSVHYRTRGDVVTVLPPILYRFYGEVKTVGELSLPWKAHISYQDYL